MCFVIAVVFFVASYNFYEKELQIQALMSALFGLVILIFFIYRVVKNRRCFFGSDKDCNKRKENP